MNQALTPAEKILGLARSFQESRVLLTAHELGLFTAIGDHGLSAAETAAAIAADHRATDRLLHALCAMGFLEKHDGRFFNTPESSRFLSKQSPDYLSGLGHMSQQYRSWGTLTQAVRQGSKVDLGQVDSDDPERTRAFIAAMHGRARDGAMSLARLIGMDRPGRILDVGGGSGVYSMALVNLLPGSTAVVLDLPKVASLTREYLTQAGMGDRIAVVEGDYNLTDFSAGFDLVLFSAVIHINSPEENIALLRKAFFALNPGGRIAIEDFVMDEGRTSPKRGALFALNMLVSTSRGDTYTEAEISSWLRLVGCESATRKPTGPASSLIIGHKPA